MLSLTQWWKDFQHWTLFQLASFVFSFCLFFLANKLKGKKMDTKIGAEGDLKAEAVNGKLQLSATYEGTDLSAGAFIAATPAQLVQALGKLIPGDSAAEHAALAVIQGALDLAVKV
jgi:hypothetical protein